jgi:ribosome-associated heat shock protein Hsp15
LVYGPGLRLDKWLWYARLTRTREQAQDLASSRRLRLDGRVIDRPSALVRPGSILSFAKDDRVMVIKVEALADRRGSYADALPLYRDLSQPETLTA